MLLSWHSGSHMSERQSWVSGRCQSDVSRWSLMVCTRVCDAGPMCGLYWHWQSPAIFPRSIESKTPGPAYQGKRINILTHGGAGSGEVKCERKEGKVCVWQGNLQLFVRNALWRPSIWCKTRINLYSYIFNRTTCYILQSEEFYSMFNGNYIVLVHSFKNVLFQMYFATSPIMLLHLSIFFLPIFKNNNHQFTFRNERTENTDKKTIDSINIRLVGVLCILYFPFLLNWTNKNRIKTVI